MLLFGFLKLLMLLVIFIFDVAFIQKYLASSSSRSYILARTGAVCGADFVLVSADTRGVTECAQVASLRADAFSVGQNGLCRAHSLPEDYGQKDYERLQQNPSAWNCLVPAANASTNASAGAWTSDPGFDFYVLEPFQSCSITSRRLDTSLGNLTRTGTSPENTPDTHEVGSAYFFAAPFELASAFGNLFRIAGFSAMAETMENTVRGLSHLFRGLVNLNLQVPAGVGLKCTGIRRLASGCSLLGVVLAMTVLPMVDIMSVLAATKEIAKVRASRAKGFVKYMTITARAQFYEQAALLLMQLTISSGVSFSAESAGVFAQHCGYLVEKENLAFLSCPVSWHAPIDAFATVLIFACLLLAVLVMLAIFGGLFYGLKPAKWLIESLFGDDLRLADFGSTGAKIRVGRPLQRSKTLGLESKFWQTVYQSHFLRPFLCIPVTLGIWTQGISRCYQIGRRQNWYEPVVGADQEQAATAEIVTWKSMYDATSKAVGLAWLPIPYVGGLLCKSATYLNEYVVFTLGKDGDHDAHDDDHERIFGHFSEDKPSTVQHLHWLSCAGQFVVMLVFNFDLLKHLDKETRLAVLTAGVAAVIVVVGIRVGCDIVQELQVFAAARGLGDFTEELLEDGVPSRAASTCGGVADSDSDDEVLGPLCKKHRSRIVQACADLVELPWVLDRKLPSAQRSLLMSVKIRTSKSRIYAGKVLRALANPKRTDVTMGTARAVVYVLTPCGRSEHNKS